MVGSYPWEACSFLKRKDKEWIRGRTGKYEGRNGEEDGGWGSHNLAEKSILFLLASPVFISHISSTLITMDFI